MANHALVIGVPSACNRRSVLRQDQHHRVGQTNVVESSSYDERAIGVRRNVRLRQDRQLAAAVTRWASCDRPSRVPMLACVDGRESWFSNGGNGRPPPVPMLMPRFPPKEFYAQANRHCRESQRARRRRRSNRSGSFRATFFLSRLSPVRANRRDNGPFR